MNDNMKNKYKKAEKNGLNYEQWSSLYLPDNAVNEINLNTQIIRQQSSFDESNQSSSLPPRVQSLQLKPSSNNEMVLEISGFDRSLKEYEILDYLKNLINETNNDSSINNMQYPMEMIVKGVVYIKFEQIKEAYLFNKNLINSIKNRNDFKNVKSRWMSSINKLENKNAEPLLVFINSKSGGG